MPGTLAIVATPIGNLGDLTLRALETLKDVDAIVCEDTRVTAKLLAHYKVQKPLISCHEHTDEKKLAGIIERLKRGEKFAYVTDAGTPGISDPGNYLVEKALAAGVTVLPIPGPTALGAIVSVAGIDLREFLFKGFPPHKKGRETFFKEVAGSSLPVIYYESPHRVVRNLALLAELAPEKKIVLGRELTKMFEEVIRGNVTEALSYFESHPDKVRGEFVVVVS
jgi:16S rRNA (cytidine1402-2'-O)-methyltransferase